MMNKYSIILFLVALTHVSCVQKKVEIGKVAIIPLPEKQLVGTGHFEINEGTSVTVETDAQMALANLFFDEFTTVSGWMPKVNIGGDGDIVFITEPTMAAEAYNLEVTPENIKIIAGSEAGFFYALQSLKQLLPVSFYSGKLQPNIVWGIPSVRIQDKPAFEWRGYMLDVSRHFFDKQQVKKVLDFMAESKLNRFHWHLADDQGWRVEIKSYPKLTEVGAWRMDYNTTDERISNWFGRPVQKPGEKPTYGGYYTQDDIKEIVAYAKERFIEVVPEIDMPGHAQAMVASYPEIGCVNSEKYVATGGVVKNNTLNPGKEETFVFAEKMLNEVMDLFPFNYMHIGGDECNKSQWLKDPDAQRRIKEEGLKDVYELQSYFIKRIEKIINARGKIMIGWDEILEGGLAPNATVMSWRGEEGGIEAAKMGHEVIMTPSNYCYIDLKQGHDDLEPNLGYSQLLLSTAYSCDVIPKGISEEEAGLIKGIQANMWTESISDWSKLTYMTFPRLYAIAESGWTSPRVKDWDNFTNRLQTQFLRLDKQGVRYAVSAYSPWIDHTGQGDNIEIALKTEVNNLDIYYTLDGSEPTMKSEQYSGNFKLNKSATIKARAFKDGQAVGYTSSMDFYVHKAAGVLNESPDLQKLTDLNYGKLNRSDPNWVSFKNGMDVTIKFDTLTAVKEVKFDALRFTIAGIYPPRNVEVHGSVNGMDFYKLGTVDKFEISSVQGRNEIPYEVAFDPVKVNYLRFIGKQINPIPKGHHMSGANAIILVDELVVE
ncbi:beta-N-acetylhexosaminidase [Arenibacter aquaticus]|uniref:beta-N-acetylhexosaminidase n=1 Tax=Arenibacter aquaticus TaxID=2489054 RepID=A0A3S0BX11_9FLAO|nr:family 20 glycosylhydrolase [Arenibacter aquaticus]RTE53573.1 beta-N-acetylhexosaminidase [Arenibacter aquaticus]